MIIHGDTFDVIQQFDDNRFDIAIVDPPYHYVETPKEFLHSHIARVTKGCIIVFCAPENQWVQLPKPDQYLFWVKPISTKNTSKSYSRFVEMILIYGRHEWNNNRHWSQYTNVFTDLVDNKSHPYRKPPSMIERLILNHSKPGDRVFDPFAGSGVVQQVCSRNNREYLGIEINAHYIGESKNERKSMC